MVGMLALFVFVLCCVSVYADTISYTINGTFSASTPSTIYSAPNETWSSSFQAVTNPTDVLEYGNGGFDFAFSDFSYLLNDSPVAVTPTFLGFFTAANGGGFFVCFSGTTVANCTEAVGNATFGPQLYTGMNSAPTPSTGSFTFDGGAITLEASAIPEPSTLLVLFTGLLALGVLHLFKA
jgi:hypothetical protein